MSLKTWKKEFYSRPLKKFTKIQAIEHSLKKWTGLSKKNIQKHGLFLKNYTSLRDAENLSINIDCESCALCVKYLKDWDGSVISKCEQCPLYITLGRACDDRTSGDSPYSLFIDNQDPEPMIVALKKCLKENSSEKKSPPLTLFIE